jgi:hypothetical protein
VPHLRDGFIVAKAIFRRSENPDTLQTLKADRAAHDSHLRRDETAPKMGHPMVMVLSDMGHSAIKKTLILASARSRPNPPHTACTPY